MERMASGIPGLDELIEGGFPTPGILLILGETGCGKTTLGLQSLVNASKSGETCIYMTGFAEPPYFIRDILSHYTFFDTSLMEKDLLQFWDLGGSISHLGPRKTLAAITEIVDESAPTRICIDPLSFNHVFSDPTEYRRYLYDFLLNLRSMNVLAIIIGEGNLDTKSMESQIADCIIELYLQPISQGSLEYHNLLHIRKMRVTDHSRDLIPIHMSKDGIKIP